MIEIPFIYIPVMALCCYFFLIMALLAAKKNRLIHSFITLLLCNLLWTGGSLLMRMQVFPSYEFWYDVSLLSLFAIPLFLYIFVHNFVKAKGHFVMHLMTVITAVMLVLTQRQVFLKRPTLVTTEQGMSYFQYAMDWPIVIPTVIFTILISCTGCLVIRAMKRHEMSSEAMLSLVIGMFTLLIGNFLSVLPGNIFPFDTLSGILNAAFLFYALYRQRMFKLTLLVSRGTLLVLSLAVVSILFSIQSIRVEHWFREYLPLFAPYSTVLFSLAFVGATSLLYFLFSRIIDNLFIKDELLQAERLRSFSSSISKSLDLNEIMSLLISLVIDVVKVDRAYLCLYQESSKSYQTAATPSPLDANTFTLAAENPCIAWMKEHKECLLLRDFSRTPAYKAMWELEKRQISDLGVNCLVPLLCGDDLVGILVLTQKSKNVAFTYDDITFLESAQSIVSIAIKNAKLYQTAYYESRIDYLTGLLNRKYFYERIQEEFDKNRDGSLALIILNLDDFKLYNQLYGNREGDLVLQQIATIILTTMGEQGFASRYSGKEFALVLPGCDTLKALKLAREIHSRVLSMHKGKEEQMHKMLTLSGGVCAYPYSASTVTQLIGNADMTVYNAKRSGKNKVLAYSMEHQPSDPTLSVEDVSQKGYSDYASTIYALTAAIDAKDHYTFQHSQNVAKYATILAKAIGMSDGHVHMLYEAALLHDIGKIGIPEQILTKPGRLTDEEYHVMQRHVENSISIIKHLPSLDYVIPAAIGHHERWDGHGYPRGLAGEDIPLAARCLAIADTFDAMTSHRPYRQSMPLEAAIQELDKMCGTQFDPRLAQVFIQLIRNGEIVPSEQPAPQDTCC